MPNRCCVPRCKSGYGTSGYNRNIHLFRIPENYWKCYEKAIPRKHFTMSHSTRICSLHFEERFLDYSSKDSNSRRSKSTLKAPRLKSGAIPSIFPNCPAYLSRPLSAPRTSTASSKVREVAPSPEDEVMMSMEVTDKIDSIRSICVSKTLPSSTSCRLEENKVIILLSDTSLLRILGRIEIFDDQRFSAYILNSQVSTDEFNHLLRTKSHVTYHSEVSNCIAHLKNLTESIDKPVHKSLINCIESLHESVEEDFLSFVLEQIRLKSTAPTCRRYSAQLYSYSYFWRSSSSACYKILSETFCLPSIKTLNRLSSGVPSEANKDYLKVRCQHLSAEERICVLMIDEVYTAEKIELNASGQMIGLTTSGEPAKTVLAFMVKSLRSNFSEMIALIPVRNLTGDQLKSHFDDVLELLKDTLLIQAISVDNHAINRKLYALLRSSGPNRSFVDHPNHENEKLFLLFDSTHNLKNIFNNFHVRQKFRFPTLEGAVKKAYFQDLVSVYKREGNQPLRRAHKLTKDILHPSSISKVSPKYALGE